MSVDTTASRPRLIYLSQLFDPEPTFKGYGFIQSLEDNGFDVEVVTGFPNYPGGKVYDGHRVSPIKREKMDQTDVTRLAVYPSHDKSAIRRIATYSSFMITAFFYLVFRARRADLIYIYYPALTAGLAAAFAKLLRGTPIILDVQDMWPDSLGSSGMIRHRFLQKFAHRLTNWVYKKSDHIIVISPGFKALMIERGVPADKISVIYNWAEETSSLKHVEAVEVFDCQDEFRILFAGNMGSAQDLNTLIDAAVILQEKASGCVFYLLGDGIERAALSTRVADLALKNVRFLPRVPLRDIQSFLLVADALVVHLVDDPLFRITIPSKIQAYLYAGRPILMGVEGEASKMIRDAGAGLLFIPGDADDLARKVETLMATSMKIRAKMGANGKVFYQTRLRRDLGLSATVDKINQYRRKTDHSTPN